MTSTLQFNLDDSGDRAAHFRCLASDDLCGALYDFDQYLRNEIKYNGKDSLQSVRDHLYSILRDRDLNLTTLWQ